MKNLYLLTDGHWHWIVEETSPDNAIRRLHSIRPDAGDITKFCRVQDLMKKYNGVIGLEGVEPPYREGR